MKKRIFNIISHLNKSKGNIVLLFLVLIFFSLNAIGQKINKNGYNKFFYPNGQISSEGYMKDGKPDGYWKTYYVTGVLKSEGRRKNYQLDSLWIFYNQSSDTIEKINYKYGTKNGYDITYRYDQKKNSNYKGYIFSRELYLNGKKEGLTYQYFSDGSVKRKENYLNGKLQGLAYEYTKNGKINKIIKTQGFASKAEIFRYLVINYINGFTRKNEDEELGEMSLAGDPEIASLTSRLEKALDNKFGNGPLPSVEEQFKKMDSL